MTFFSCRLVTTPQLRSSNIVLSSVLCKVSHNLFHSGVTPWMVSPVAVRLPYCDHSTEGIVKLLTISPTICGIPTRVVVTHVQGC